MSDHEGPSLPPGVNRAKAIRKIAFDELLGFPREALAVGSRNMDEVLDAKQGKVFSGRETTIVAAESDADRVAARAWFEDRVEADFLFLPETEASESNRLRTIPHGFGQMQEGTPAALP